MKNFIHKVLRVSNRMTLKRIEILVRSKKYRDDKNYQIDEVDKCFEDRMDRNSDDTAILKRISAAYIAASRDQVLHSEVFRPSNEWLPIYEKGLEKVIGALKNSDVQALGKIYRNFFRDPCSNGIVTTYDQLEKAFLRNKISYLNRLDFLNNAVHRFNLWKHRLGGRYTAENLASPAIGNPYGYFVDGQFVRVCADYQHYYATRIRELTQNKENPVIAEIGGGFGGMAYFLNRDTPNAKYFDFDLIESIALTSYYLLKAFPEKKVLLYGEDNFENAIKGDYDIILMPAFQIDKLDNGSCDAVFNSYSLAEMSPQAIAHYLDRTSKILATGGSFFHVNHTKHSVVGARDFPISDDLKFVSEEIAEWNLGVNSRMDEYEFLYKKV